MNEIHTLILFGFLNLDCSSMDNHPTAQNMIRPDIHSGVVPSHQHHFQLPSHNHQHQAAMITGSTMGGVIVDRDYAPENQMFRTPASINPGGMSSHPYAIPPGESAMPPDSSPTSSSSYGDLSKSFGRKRSRKRPKVSLIHERCGDAYIIMTDRLFGFAQFSNISFVTNRHVGFVVTEQRVSTLADFRVTVAKHFFDDLSKMMPTLHLDARMTVAVIST